MITSSDRRWGSFATTNVTNLTSSDQLVCASPASFPGSVALEVTANGQQYLQPSLNPAKSPGTSTGRRAPSQGGCSGQSSRVIIARWQSRCEFSPPRPPRRYSSGEVQFSSYLHPAVMALSIPGQLGEFDSWLATKIVYPHAPAWPDAPRSIQPGFSLVRVWGSGFMGGTDYRCKLNVQHEITATYDPRLDCIRCWSDLWLDGINLVEVTLNGRQ